MTPAPFEYIRAETVEEALAALAEHGEEAAVLAGGQSLVPMLAMRLARPSVVIDIGGLAGLDNVTHEGKAVSVGALVRHRRMELDAEIARALPVFAEAARWVATPAVRNAGTVGGALALGDPAAEYPAVALALEARLRLASARGERRVDAANFFLGAMETAAASDELLLGVEIEAAAPDDGFGFCEIAERRGDYALAGAVVVRRTGTGARVRVAVFGAGEVACMAEGAAGILSDVPPSAWDARHLEAVKDAARSDLGDLALDAFHARLAGVAVARAARQLAEGEPDERRAA